jgi:exodeoxyribonuclease-3
VTARAKRRKTVRIVSWNVNGLRACAAKGFLDWLAGSGSEIVGVQEVRALPEQLPEEVRAPRRWHVRFSPAERKGYSGVGLYSRRAPDALETSLDEARFDAEGRLQIARFGRLVVVNGYFPKGSGNERDNSRVPYKLDFYRAVFERVQRLRRGGLRVLVMGAELDRWVDAGWVDTFRAFEAGAGHYSWWSQRFGMRAKNVGWRIDYVLAAPAAMKFVRGAFIWPEVTGSDHAPVGIEVDPGIFD